MFVKNIEQDKKLTNSNEIEEICLHSVSVREFHIYIGSFGNLINISDKIKYHVETIEEMGEEVIYITLKEVYEQVLELFKKTSPIKGEKLSPFITVFDESPSRTRIYQCGNYGDGYWVKLGDIQGYA